MPDLSDYSNVSADEAWCDKADGRWNSWRPIIIIVKHISTWKLILPFIKYPQPAPPPLGLQSRLYLFRKPKKMQNYVELYWVDSSAHWALGPVGGLVEVGLLRHLVVGLLLQPRTP